MTIYARLGYIQSASNICGLDLLEKSGHSLPDDELVAILKGDLNVTDCDGGIMESANAFAMTRFGFTNIALYTASLQEWAADPENPMVVGTS